MSASAKMVDFTNVKDGGNFNKARIPAGDYQAKIMKVEDAQAKDETFQYLFTIQLTKRSASKFPYYCKLQENQLWKLRNLLIAAGISVPKSKMKVDVNRLVNKIIGVTVDDTEFDNKEQSEITAVFPAAELADSAPADDDDDDDDEVADDSLDELDDDTEVPDEDADEAEEEAEEEEEAVDEGDEWDAITDRLELRKALKKVAPDVKTSTSMTEDDIRDLIRKHSAPAPAAKGKPASVGKKKAAEVSDDELDSLDIDDL